MKSDDRKYSLAQTEAEIQESMQVWNKRREDLPEEMFQSAQEMKAQAIGWLEYTLAGIVLEEPVIAPRGTLNPAVAQTLRSTLEKLQFALELEDRAFEESGVPWQEIEPAESA